MFRASRTVLTASVILIAAAAHGEGIASHVTKVDSKAGCLSIEWDNDTERLVCWKPSTKFSVLETSKPASPTDVRKGSYLRIQGNDEAGKFWATEIVICEQVSRPATP